MLTSKLTVENSFSPLVNFNHACQKSFSGVANEELAPQIAGIMGTQLSSIKNGRYVDDEIASYPEQRARQERVHCAAHVPAC